LRNVVISNNEPVEVILYPDSGKVGAVSRAFGKTLWHLTRQSAATEYYGGGEQMPQNDDPAAANSLRSSSSPNPVDFDHLKEQLRQLPAAAG